jgi:hypothetical protein
MNQSQAAKPRHTMIKKVPMMRGKNHGVKPKRVPDFPEVAIVW